MNLKTRLARTLAALGMVAALALGGGAPPAVAAISYLGGDVVSPTVMAINRVGGDVAPVMLGINRFGAD